MFCEEMILYKSLIIHMDHTDAHLESICALIYHCKWLSHIENPARNSQIQMFAPLFGPQISVDFTEKDKFFSIVLILQHILGQDEEAAFDDFLSCLPLSSLSILPSNPFLLSSPSYSRAIVVLIRSLTDHCWNGN